MADDALTIELLLKAYSTGIFPMSESRTDGALFWVDPKRRGVMPLDGFHISRTLAKRIRGGQFTITVDHAFEQVVDRCADRHETWINGTLHRLYLQLHAQGHAHSVEAWQEGALVGGAFGIAIGGAFFGESMFSTRTDASKVATAYLVDRLRQGGFVLLDTQFLTPHLASLGGIEISRARYRSELAVAIAVAADFNRQGVVPDGYSLLQRSIQTS